MKARRSRLHRGGGFTITIQYLFAGHTTQISVLAYGNTNHHPSSLTKRAPVAMDSQCPKRQTQKPKEGPVSTVSIARLGYNSGKMDTPAMMICVPVRQDANLCSTTGEEIRPNTSGRSHNLEAALLTLSYSSTAKSDILVSSTAFF